MDEIKSYPLDNEGYNDDENWISDDDAETSPLYQQDAQMETSFSYKQDAQAKTSYQRDDLKLGLIKDLFDRMGWEYDENMIKLHLERYKIEHENGSVVLFFEKGGKWYNITDKRTGGFRSKGAIEKIITTKHKHDMSVSLLEKTPTELEMSDLSGEKVVEAIDRVSRDIGTNTVLDMREFIGIDKALTRVKGELLNNASKLTKIDEHITLERKKLAEIKDSPDLKKHKGRIEARLKDLKEERLVRLEILSQNRKELASQFSRIRQTVEKILDGDLSLREKIKLVFREHGLTIVAVLTSLGLIVGTIVSSLTGGGGSSSTPPKHPNKLGQWVKNKLKALARLFGRLAGKAAAALPGIIGAIISGALNFLKKVVTGTADHIWLFMTSIATLVGYKILYPATKK